MLVLVLIETYSTVAVIANERSMLCFLLNEGGKSRKKSLISAFLSVQPLTFDLWPISREMLPDEGEEANVHREGGEFRQHGLAFQT